MGTPKELNAELNHADVYGVRTLVFMEVEPQSNKYNQVFFTPEEFKVMFNTIGKVLTTDGEYEERKVEHSEEEYDLPDLQEINE